MNMLALASCITLALVLIFEILGFIYHKPIRYSLLSTFVVVLYLLFFYQQIKPILLNYIHSAFDYFESLVPDKNLLQ